MNSLTIRRATSSDAERIVKLRLLAQQHFEKSNPSIWQITEQGKKLLKQRVENDIVNSNIRILLAEVEGEIIGYVQGEITRRIDYMPRTVGQISLAYVSEKCRRKGVGRRLVKELCRFFNSNKAEYLTVRYVIGDKEAEGFWRKLEFEPILTTCTTYLKELNPRLQI